MSKKKQFDVVVLGASGFTGKWVAKHLFERYPDDTLSWAMAGRNTAKLEATRDFIGDEKGSVSIITADSANEKSLDDLCEQAKVIISTVGPYTLYGSSLVKACSESGTHYVDLTGEVPWMRTMIDAHHEAAVKSGACLVHSCGFDSIPSDIGVHVLQTHAKAELGTYLENIQMVVGAIKGGMSGGTYHSMVNIIKEATKSKEVRRLLINPYSLNPDPELRGKDSYDQSTPIHHDGLKKWTAPFIMGAINSRIVRRTHALEGFLYGKNFKYAESMATGGGAMGYLKAQSVAVSTKALSVFNAFPVGRTVLNKFMPAQGEGPKVDPGNPGFYKLHFLGQTADKKPMNLILRGDADPGYGSTSKMLSEAAVCLALDFDDKNRKRGFWTPASAMGDQLAKRLSENAGLSFEFSSKA